MNLLIEDFIVLLHPKYAKRINRMKKTTIVALAAFPFLLTSCIQDEEENTECDIKLISLHFDEPSRFFISNLNDTIKDVDQDDRITYSANSFVFTISTTDNDLTVLRSIPTTIQVTDGATPYLKTEDGNYVPFLSGSPVDYSDEQVRWFRVESQDKMWNRDYAVKVAHAVPSDGNFYEDFDVYRLDATGKYYEWKCPDVFADGTWDKDKVEGGTWKNGNPGFKISKSSAKPMDYPSTPVVGGGPDGSDCVKLETRDTGRFGRLTSQPMPIAPGSMFIGVFDVSNALLDALKATQFGFRYAHKPLQLRIWLRYEPGDIFQDRYDNVIPGIIDEPDVYVGFYRNQDASGNEVQINGHDMWDSPYIIGKGRLAHHLDSDGKNLISGNPIHGVTSEWQEFILPIKYTSEPDPDILKKYGYSLFFSISSSWVGGEFQGAVGSKLYIDNMQIICEEETTDNE